MRTWMSFFPVRRVIISHHLWDFPNKHPLHKKNLCLNRFTWNRKYPVEREKIIQKNKKRWFMRALLTRPRWMSLFPARRVIISYHLWDFPNKHLLHLKNLWLNRFTGNRKYPIEREKIIQKNKNRWFMRALLTDDFYPLRSTNTRIRRNQQSY